MEMEREIQLVEAAGIDADNTREHAEDVVIDETQLTEAAGIDADDTGEHAEDVVKDEIQLAEAAGIDAVDIGEHAEDVVIDEIQLAEAAGIDADDTGEHAEDVVIDEIQLAEAAGIDADDTGEHAEDGVIDEIQLEEAAGIDADDTGEHAEDVVIDEIQLAEAAGIDADDTGKHAEDGVIDEIQLAEAAGIDADDTGEHAEDGVIDEIPLAEAAGIDADDTGEQAEDVVIDVDLSWLNSMEEKLASTCAKSSPSFTICRVPAHIRDCDSAAYSPKIISIGPFHRQSTNLLAMEEHKWRYLQKVLGRHKSGNNLAKYLKVMKEKEPQARNCYSENITMESNEFTEMMVLDGCFVLQFIHETNNDLADDPIYSNDWAFSRIFHDMLLLENQLPFFVLECLWELSGQPKATLRNEALNFFDSAFPSELERECPEEPHIHHLIHAVHLSHSPARKRQFRSTATGKLSCLQLCKVMGKILPFTRCLVKTRDTSTPTSQQSLLDYNPPSPVKMVPCAMELQEAGFRFRRKQARSFFDVTFEKGLMKMPSLRIDDHTVALFRNFIAFEQCFPEMENHFTSYCFLIDALVNTPRDVSILTQSNIIVHMLGSDEEVALLFNKLCKEIVWVFRRSYLANMFEEVIQHTQKRCPKWRAKLVHDYFSNPWAIISLIAAIIVIIFALVQTFFAVFAYFRPT